MTIEPMKKMTRRASVARIARGMVVPAEAVGEEAVLVQVRQPRGRAVALIGQQPDCRCRAQDDEQDDRGHLDPRQQGLSLGEDPD